MYTIELLKLVSKININTSKTHVVLAIGNLT